MSVTTQGPLAPPPNYHPTYHQPPAVPPPPPPAGGDSEDGERVPPLPPWLAFGVIPIDRPEPLSHLVWAGIFGVGARQARDEIKKLPVKLRKKRGRELFATAAAVWAHLPNPDD